MVKIKVKLFATLRLGRGKEIELDIKEGSTVEEVIKIVGIELKEIAIILRNGKDADLGTQLENGDILSIFPAVGGG
jgi:molybdopterin converting factor small subunit